MTALSSVQQKTKQEKLEKVLPLPFVIEPMKVCLEPDLEKWLPWNRDISTFTTLHCPALWHDELKNLTHNAITVLSSLYLLS